MRQTLVVIDFCYSSLQSGAIFWKCTVMQAYCKGKTHISRRDVKRFTVSYMWQDLDSQFRPDLARLLLGLGSLQHSDSPQRLGLGLQLLLVLERPPPPGFASNPAPAAGVPSSPKKLISISTCGIHEYEFYSVWGLTKSITASSWT